MQTDARWKNISICCHCGLKNSYVRQRLQIVHIVVRGEAYTWVAMSIPHLIATTVTARTYLVANVSLHKCRH